MQLQCQLQRAPARRSAPRRQVGVAAVRPRLVGLAHNRSSSSILAAAAASQHSQHPGSSSRSIIVAVDESEDLARLALSSAVSLFHREGDSFKLVHCVPVVPPGRLVAVQGAGLLHVPRVDPALLAAKAVAEAESSGLAAQLMQRLADAGVQGSFEVLQGPPADAKASISAALCERARSDSAAAVVIASASRGGLREAVFGSVAANLVRDCPAPVAVVVLHKPREDSSSSGSGSSEHGVAWLMRATAQEVLGDAVAGHVEEAAPATAEPPAQQPQPQEQQHKARRALVVAVDDSDEGYAAVDWVLRHMWLPDDELHILHVVPVLSTHLSCSLAPDGMLYNLPLPQLEEAQVQEGLWRELLLERLGPLLQANAVDFRLDVLTDYGADPLQGVASAVVSTAERLGAAALVVSGHSKGQMVEWLLGSVSDFAVHHANVPVVVLHGAGGGGGEGAVA